MPVRGGATQSSLLPILGALLLCGCTKVVELPFSGAPDGSVGDGAPGSGGRAGAMGTGTGGAGGMGGDPFSGGRGWSGGRGASDGGVTDAGSNRDVGGCLPTKIPSDFFDLRSSNVIFVLGRNQSMGERFGDTTRMSAVTSMLEKLLMPLKSGLKFGYVESPSIEGCSSQSMCCATGLERSIWPSLDNWEDGLQRAFARCPPGSASTQGCVSSSPSRPITQALLTTQGIYSNISSSSKYAVLVLDGVPGCMGEDPVMACGTAGIQVSQLANSNINTFVVAMGDTSGSYPCLEDLAYRGKMPRPGPSPVYSAQDPTALNGVLNEIIDAVAAPACRIDLDSPVPDATRVSLLAGLDEIPNDSQGKDGWRFVPGSQRSIQIFGKACRTILQTHAQDITLWSGCPPCTAAPCR